ncbi:MAG: RNA-binding domain-containing protein [Desulfurococcaceae archaeon]
MVEIIVETEVRPTEDIEKVKKALQTIVTLEDLKVAEITTGFKTISVKCESIKCLEPLRNAIRIQQIEPAVRAYLYKRIENSTLVILIHKQAAFAGKVSLIDSDRESPLGPIRITITGTSNEIEEVIKFLTEE